MEFNTLNKIYYQLLRDIYSAEKLLGHLLPKIIKAVGNKDLRSVIVEHQELTRLHSSRIEEIFKNNSSHPAGENCDPVESMIDEFEDLIEEIENSDIIDMLLISTCQKINHYKIASYNTAITYTKGLGYDKAMDLLQKSLDEEYETDNKLDKLADEIIQIFSKVNS